MSHVRPSAVPAAPNPPVARRGFLAKAGAVIAGAVLLGRVSKGEAATQSTTPYLGEIMLFAGNFAPVGWMACDGQVLSIALYQALFSILGTNFGGDGRTTFGLPDLRGRAPIHFGQGPGLSAHAVGEMSGVEAVTLLSSQMPAHNHPAVADSGVGTSDAPANLVPARNAAGAPQYAVGNGTAMSAAHIGVAGGGLPHNNMPPYLVMTYCIAITGVFPTR